jgi:hypothetical protein
MTYDKIWVPLPDGNTVAIDRDLFHDWHEEITADLRAAGVVGDDLDEQVATGLTAKVWLALLDRDGETMH